MTHKHRFTYVHAGLQIKLTDAQAADLLRDAKEWGYKLDSIDTVYGKTSDGSQYATAHFFFTMEENGKLRSFSLFREAWQYWL